MREKLQEYRTNQLLAYLFFGLLATVFDIFLADFYVIIFLC
ncbi:hypothetical protein ACVRZD_07360 [Streptococcus hongkongensis]